MDDLAKRECEACKIGSEKVKPEEIEKLLKEIPEWEVIECYGKDQLQKIFSFNNFKDALDFTNKVGLLAEKENHHPAILTEWGKVTVTWWTHIIKGLHINDFIMAAKTDRVTQQ